MKRSISLSAHLRLLIALGLLAWAVAGCAGGSGSSLPAATAQATIVTPPASLLATTTAAPGDSIAPLPFQSLAQGFRLDSAQSSPALVIAANPESRAAMISLIDSAHQSLLTNVDLNQSILLAATWGVKPSGGYSITISQIFIADGTLTVDVLLNENDPGFPRIEASTFPYHIVTIDRTALPVLANLPYRLVSGDTLLAAGTLN